jgi:hypothetical protein
MKTITLSGMGGEYVQLAGLALCGWDNLIRSTDKTISGRDKEA